MQEFHGRQEQLLRVLAHHMCYVKERLNHFGSIDKEVFITSLISHGRIASGGTIGLRKRDLASGREIFTPLKVKSESRPHASNFMNTNHSHFSRPKSQDGAENFFNQHSMAAINTFRGSANGRDQHLEETSKTIPPALDQRKRDISHPTLDMNADTVFERKNDCGIIQRHANARYPYVVDPQPEDRHSTFGDHNEIDPAISTTTAAPLPGLQSNTFCSRCGCLRTSYKPSQGLVSCDGCFTPYQSNDLAAACWGLGNHRSIEPSFDPPSGLSDYQSELGNHALTPEITTLGSHGNDLDDFSWFMAS